MLKVTAFGDVFRFDSARSIMGRGRYWTSAYLVDGLLIDTGCAYAAKELLDELEDPPEGILNTHSHEDHIGANGPLQRRCPDLVVRIHPAGLPVIADPRVNQPLHPYRRLYWGWPEPSRGLPLAGGETIRTENYAFEVLYTPGHSIDHVCFYEPNQGWLFSGDLYVGGREKALRIDYDIWKIIDSLKMVGHLPLTMLFPGAARVRSDPSERVLFGGPMQVEWMTLGHFSRKGLVRSFLHQSEYPETHPDQETVRRMT